MNYKEILILVTGITDSLLDDQKVEIPISVYCLNDQSLRSKVIPVIDYIVLEGANELALIETSIRTDIDKLTIH